MTIFLKSRWGCLLMICCYVITTKLKDLKQYTYLKVSLCQVSRNRLVNPLPKVSQGCNKGVCWALFLSELLQFWLKRLQLPRSLRCLAEFVIMWAKRLGFSLAVDYRLHSSLPCGAASMAVYFFQESKSLLSESASKKYFLRIFNIIFNPNNFLKFIFSLE